MRTGNTADRRKGKMGMRKTVILILFRILGAVLLPLLVHWMVTVFALHKHWSLVGFLRIHISICFGG